MSDKTPNIEFRTLRSVRLASTTGHIILMEPGTPVALPPSMHAEAYAAGCAPVDSPEHIVPAVPQGEDRERAIIEAIHNLITAGDKDKFRKDGVPKVVAIEEIFGFAVSGAEVVEAFDKVSAISEKLQKPKEVKEDKKVEDKD